jgi:alpha-amylase/alpha-mannosidase (GH57 family)
MVRLLREFPEVRVTFNLVPSLLVQLEAFVEERARDWHLELGLKPAAALSDDDRARILAEFFHAPRGRMIEPYPRYAELLAKRGEGTAIRDRIGAFTDADFLDLQVWHKLSWVDPFYLDGDERIRRLLAKGRDFDERDKGVLRGVELEILRAIVPEYRAAAGRGQIELSTSPFYHPILPLLCDTDIYLTTHPGAAVPLPPFRRPEDAAMQLSLAAQYHERLFDRAPDGFWPSEGSVSDAIVKLGADGGFSWMATDEAILSRSLNLGLRRDGAGHLEQPELLYKPYRVRSGSSEIRCLFRDRVLSDLIGFTYASWGSDAAAADLVNRIAEAGRRFSARTGGAEATVPIILDGENAWEHYEGGGRPFLRALYAKLSAHPELETVTMSQATSAPASSPPGILNGIFPGSWIDGNFYIWIGHADDQRAWRQLREAREALDETSNLPPDRATRARDEILIAEGSDWCWWYGDDHSSEHDLAFDDLFRRHLRNAYQALGKPIPEELFQTNISTGRVQAPVTHPVALLKPTIDGRLTSYFEWLAGGIVDTSPVAGAMHAGDRPPALVRTLLFGCDAEHLYVRIDLTTRAAAAIDRGVRCHLTFTSPADRRVVIAPGHQPPGMLTRKGTNGRWEDVNPVDAAVDDIVEISVPFADLGLARNDQFAFFVSLVDAGAELERHPPHRPVQERVPGSDFEQAQWRA